jgi:hypothetical protein
MMNKPTNSEYISDRLAKLAAAASGISMQIYGTRIEKSSFLDNVCRWWGICGIAASRIYLVG